MRVFTERVTVPQEPLVLLVEDDPLAREGLRRVPRRRRAFASRSAERPRTRYARRSSSCPTSSSPTSRCQAATASRSPSDLRVQTRTHSIPVVAMTAYWAADVHERADRAGMTAILMKPCQPDHLIAELHRVLRSTQLRRVAAARCSPSPALRRKPEAASFLDDAAPDPPGPWLLAALGLVAWPR